MDVHLRDINRVGLGWTKTNGIIQFMLDFAQPWPELALPRSSSFKYCVVRMSFKPSSLVRRVLAGRRGGPTWAGSRPPRPPPQLRQLCAPPRGHPRRHSRGRDRLASHDLMRRRFLPPHCGPASCASAARLPSRPSC
jgi:hypothetical protein